MGPRGIGGSEGRLAKLMLTDIQLFNRNEEEVLVLSSSML